MPILRWILPLGALLLLAPRADAQSSSPDPDLSTVRHVDLPRYMGRWYVIARVPGLLDWGKVATRETYSQQPDGAIQDVFSFRKANIAAPEQMWNGSAVVTDGNTNALWRVRFFWPFWPFTSSYRVLALDPNYGWAVVATDSGSLYRILSRTPQLDQDTFQEIVERLRRRRLDPDRMELVAQPAELPGAR